MDSPADNKHTFFDCLSPGCGAAAATAIAEILADGLDTRQINALAGFLAVISQVLSYMATQELLNETMCPNRAGLAATAAGNTGSENMERNEDNTRPENTERNEGKTRPENTERNEGYTRPENMEKNTDNTRPENTEKNECNTKSTYDLTTQTEQKRPAKR